MTTAGGRPPPREAAANRSASREGSKRECSQASPARQAGGPAREAMSESSMSAGEEIGQLGGRVGRGGRERDRAPGWKGRDRQEGQEVLERFGELEHGE